MANIRSKLFLGCNYNDQSIKSSFNNIRDRIEKDTPLQCIVIDKRTNKAAKDLWVDIQKEIAEAALCVFDISGFRPNVILELGLALAIKNNDQILITFRTRRTKGKQPQWLLSDIGHLQRFQYGAIPDLERHIREQIEHLDYMKSFKDFLTRCKSDTTAPDKYALNGLK